MGASVIDLQHDAVLQAIRNAGRGEWKLLVLDQSSARLIHNVVKEEEILNEKIATIEQIEQRRATNRDMDAIYILTPEPHIVECVTSDVERRRYRRGTLLWTSLLQSPLRDRIDKAKGAREFVVEFQVLNLGYYPRESNLVTFRDPWSFPILYHPQCNSLVRQHFADLAQKIVAVCVSLGEYPTIRYFKKDSAGHEAGVLCSHLARFVQEEIDKYATYHSNFPPPSTRPRATLYIVDRSMDLIAPLVHEFTYQAMVHDLLPIKEGDRVTYRVVTNEGRSDQEVKELEVSEKDKVWISNRHKHMKDTIERLMGEFQAFLEENPHFANADSKSANSLNVIKDMLAGLPQFQQRKEAYSLHLTMAQDCMAAFQRRKLPDLASVEQSLATGLDEEYKKPKNLADQVVRTLDEETIAAPDRLRLLLLYILYRDGLLPADTSKLLAHAQLGSQEAEIIRNLSLLGARTTRALKDPRPSAASLFPRKQAPANVQDDYSLSRFQPALKSLLEEHCSNTLDQEFFPYTKPQLDASDELSQNGATSTSLRSAKPTWAKSRGALSNEPRQRVIVFVAGGATYSESRTCYEITRDLNKDVYLLTSHMQTPGFFLRQVSDLSLDRRSLCIPADQPKPKAPAHVFEVEPQDPNPQKIPASVASTTAPQTAHMASLRIGSGTGDGRSQNGSVPSASIAAPQKEEQGDFAGKSSKELEKEKKKRHFFSSKK